MPSVKLNRVRRMLKARSKRHPVLYGVVQAGLCEEETVKERPDEREGYEPCRNLHEKRATQVSSQPDEGQRVLQKTGSCNLGRSSEKLLGKDF